MAPRPGLSALSGLVGRTGPTRRATSQRNGPRLPASATDPGSGAGTPSAGRVNVGTPGSARGSLTLPAAPARAAARAREFRGGARRRRRECGRGGGRRGGRGSAPQCAPRARTVPVRAGCRFGCTADARRPAEVSRLLIHTYQIFRPKPGIFPHLTRNSTLLTGVRPFFSFCLDFRRALRMATGIASTQPKPHPQCSMQTTVRPPSVAEVALPAVRGSHAEARMRALATETLARLAFEKRARH